MLRMTPEKNLSTPTKWEYLVPVLASVSLLISCIMISSKKIFWNDEFYSYYLLSDPSFTHMLVAFHDKINNTPPLYFILGWLWAKAFGSTELSLRLFSSLGMCVACVVVWITLRRTYKFWPASIGTLGVFCTSEFILSQNAEARMYGLFLAVCSLALLQFDINNRNSKCSLRIILSNAFIHASIVQSHLLGLFYSVAAFFSQVIRDRYFKVFKPRIYLSIVISWLSLILYIPSFLNQADAGNPRTWIPVPLIKDLIDLLSLSSSSFLNPLVVLALVLFSGLLFLFKVYVSRTSQINKQKRPNINREISLLIFACAFLAVPVFVWIISRTIKPIFVDRYMIPSVLSWSILLAYLSSRIICVSILSNEISKRSRIAKVLVAVPILFLLFVLTTILLVEPIRYAKSYPRQYLPGLNDNKYGYKALPIAVQSSDQFLKRVYYSPERNRYFFILDWQAAVDNASGQFGPQEYKHLDAIKRNYPNLFPNNIITSEDFLRSYNRFLVLDYKDYNKKCPSEVMGLEKARDWEDMHCPRWVEMRLLSNPNYKVTHLGDIYGEALLLVEKNLDL